MLSSFFHIPQIVHPVKYIQGQIKICSQLYYTVGLSQVLNVIAGTEKHTAFLCLSVQVLSGLLYTRCNIMEYQFNCIRCKIIQMVFCPFDTDFHVRLKLEPPPSLKKTNNNQLTNQADFLCHIPNKNNNHLPVM